MKTKTAGVRGEQTVFTVKQLLFAPNSPCLQRNSRCSRRAARIFSETAGAHGERPVFSVKQPVFAANSPFFQ